MSLTTAILSVALITACFDIGRVAASDPPANSIWGVYENGGGPPTCRNGSDGSAAPGQEQPFQGANPLWDGTKCARVNICHGNAGFGWNPITVSKASLDERKDNGHSGKQHNNRNNRRPDYFPSTTSVPNLNGAGNHGAFDENCNFICADDDDCGGTCAVSAQCEDGTTVAYVEGVYPNCRYEMCEDPCTGACKYTLPLFCKQFHGLCH